MFRGAKAILLLALASGASSVENGGDAGSNAISLDTDRNEPLVFDTRASRKGGHSYIDDIEIHADIDLDVAGQHVTTTSTIHLTSEMKVEDLPQGGQEIEASLTAVSLESNTGGMTISCDSHQLSQASPFCKPMLDAVGDSQHFVVDDEGNVAEQQEPAQDAAKASQQHQISPLNHLQQTSRTLKFLPTHPALPGDTWELSVDLGEEMGHLTGTASLLGYTDYKGSDVAVIAVDGTLDIDMQKLAQKMQLPGVDSVSVDDIKFKSKMFWDPKEQLGRWSELNQSFVMTMASPYGGDDIVAPVFETITASTDILM